MPEENNLPGEKRVTKRFRVAREGQTVDGRELTALNLMEMAATYDANEYAARINCEHILGYSPKSDYKSYGDVLLVEAEKHEFNTVDGKQDLLCLYATISALPEMVDLAKKGQKIYPSIEMHPNFAGSGRAYLVGLAMTDSPASRGTQPYKFSASKPNSLFSEPHEDIFIMSNQDQPNQDSADDLGTSVSSVETTGSDNHSFSTDDTGFISKLKQVFSSGKAKLKLSADFEDTLIGGLTSFSNRLEQAETAVRKFEELKKDFNSLKQEHDSLVESLQNTESNDAATVSLSSGQSYEAATY